jgi:hypothetical protein
MRVGKIGTLNLCPWQVTDPKTGLLSWVIYQECETDKEHFEIRVRLTPASEAMERNIDNILKCWYSRQDSEAEITFASVAFAYIETVDAIITLHLKQQLRDVSAFQQKVARMIKHFAQIANQ